MENITFDRNYELTSEDNGYLRNNQIGICRRYDR